MMYRIALQTIFYIKKKLKVKNLRPNCFGLGPQGNMSEPGHILLVMECNTTKCKDIRQSNIQQKINSITAGPLSGSPYCAC